MAQRNVLYLTLARKCAQRGESARAMITVINALNTNSQYIEAEPDFIDLLADLYDPERDLTFDGDINALEANHPIFGDRLRDALVLRNKRDAAAHRELSFEEYCISQMKYTQNAAATMMPQVAPHAFSAHNPAAICPTPTPPPMASSAVWGACDASQTAGGLCSAIQNGTRASLPSLRAVGHTRQSLPIADPVAQTAATVSDGAPLRGLQQNSASCGAQSDANAFRALPLAADCAARAWSEAVSDRDAGLPYDVSALNISVNSCRHAPGIGAQSNLKRNGGGGSGDGGFRRFERIDLSRQTHIAAADYADTAADRVIVDFDNAIKENPKSEFFSASKTKFRSYGEDVAAMRESGMRKKINRAARDAQTPSNAERIAEKTHELSDTPSVEPCADKTPLQFAVTPKQILACAALCLSCVFALVSYQSAKPDLEKRAAGGIAASYIVASSAPGAENPAADAAPALIDPVWRHAYEIFLATWHSVFFDAPIAEIPTPDAGDPAPLRAAYIDRCIADGNAEEAMRYFKTLPADGWGAHAYFKTWSEASIRCANRDFKTAAALCKKLLKSPLAPFALTRLGLIALEHQNDEARAAFSQSTEARAGAIPKTQIALCIQSVFDRGITQAPQTPDILPPADAYCAVGRLFSALRRGAPIGAAGFAQDRALADRAHNEIVAAQKCDAYRTGAPHECANSPKNDGLPASLYAPQTDVYIIEALIRAEIALKNPARAAQYARSVDLPDDHPQRRAIFNAISDEALALGDWDILRAADPAFPAGAQICDAMRFIDDKRRKIPYAPSPASGILQYGKTPAFSSLSASNIAENAQNVAFSNTQIDAIYRDAYNGMLDSALQKVRNPDILNAHPREALLLQAAILSAKGKNADAAQVLGGDFKDGARSLPFIILENRYRMRAGIDLSPQAFIVAFVSSEDPSVESARCEILWRLRSDGAHACIARLSRMNPKTKSGWIMAHLRHPAADPAGSAAQWAGADAAALSFPEFPLAYARVLAREGQYRAAAKQYARAIAGNSARGTQGVIGIIGEFETVFSADSRRLIAAREFDALIAKGELSGMHPSAAGAMHLAAARLYQPKSANAAVKIHLARALEKLGDRPDILREFVRYYDAKNKPDSAAKYRKRLQTALSQNSPESR